MPYSKKVDELRLIEQQSAEVLANAQWDEEDVARNRHLRDTLLKMQAQICNTQLKTLKRESEESFGGNLSLTIDAALSQNAYSADEMETIFRFGPEWGNLLTTDSRGASLYQLEITDRRTGDTYYKVGHTGGSVQARMKSLGICKQTFDVNVHHTILFREKWCAEAEEKRLHARNADHRYMGSPIMSNGHTEVYTQPLVGHKLKLELCLYSLLGVARY